MGGWVGLVREEVPDLSALPTPTESETKDITSLKFEAMGPAQGWLLQDMEKGQQRQAGRTGCTGSAVLPPLRVTGT